MFDNFLGTRGKWPTQATGCLSELEGSVSLSAPACRQVCPARCGLPFPGTGAPAWAEPTGVLGSRRPCRGRPGSRPRLSQE